MQHEQLQAIQEAIAGFLREQVINRSGEFHYNPNETMIPNNDDHCMPCRSLDDEVQLVIGLEYQLWSTTCAVIDLENNFYIYIYNSIIYA